VREGVRQGVRSALNEILSDPKVFTLIRATVAAQAADSQPPPAMSTPSSASGEPRLFPVRGVQTFSLVLCPAPGTASNRQKVLCWRCLGKFIR
jgi:hypothetical protein